ncbi:uncharacterized protein LOC123653764 [Melitaea cinxia]|uniref:uncharacterized protein LOC123653764 n=1 Tax=Melitaea cinxia TaxID=113334 RepID=UPI001E27206F|nr:uncharacterized protein LOC123653764 [Melitaea cinxia]
MRIRLSWETFGRLLRVFTSKTKVFEQCILPVLIYGAETWTLTRALVHKFKVAQSAMEQAILGVFLKIGSEMKLSAGERVEVAVGWTPASQDRWPLKQTWSLYRVLALRSARQTIFVRLPVAAG